jgi:hypothetical protein
MRTALSLSPSSSSTAAAAAGGAAAASAPSHPVQRLVRSKCALQLIVVDRMLSSSLADGAKRQMHAESSSSPIARYSHVGRRLLLLLLKLQ